jgi:hypothetical protein
MHVCLHCMCAAKASGLLRASALLCCALSPAHVRWRPMGVLARGCRHPRRCARGHDVERPVGEAQHRKSAKRAFATKGRKFASLTSDFIQFPRQHEPRRARHGSPGGARAPRMPSSRQSTGTGTAARACAPDKDCKQPRRLRQGIDTPVTSATSAPRRL